MNVVAMSDGCNQDFRMLPVQPRHDFSEVLMQFYDLNLEKTTLQLLRLLFLPLQFVRKNVQTNDIFIH